MKILLTGATGFIGHHMLTALRQHGHQVVAFTRTFEQMRALPREVRAFAGDITQPDTLGPALRGVQTVIHLAAARPSHVPPKDAARLARINVAGAGHVLTAARQAGASQVLLVADVAVYGDTAGRAVPEGHPATAPTDTWAHLTLHQGYTQVLLPALAEGARLALLGAVYGPGDLSARGGWPARLRAGRWWLAWGGANRRSWVPVAEAVAGLMQVLHHGEDGRAYHLAGPAHTVQEMVETGAAVLGGRAPRLWVPAAWARVLARALARPAPRWAEFLRSQTGTCYVADSTRAQTELGWAARPIEAGWRAWLTG